VVKCLIQIIEVYLTKFDPAAGVMRNLHTSNSVEVFYCLGKSWRLETNLVQLWERYNIFAVGQKLSIVVVGKIRCKCSKNIY